MDPFREFLLRPKFQHYVAKMVELGFTQYGPTMIISGTLTASSRVVFISELTLTLTRKRDTSRFLLTWFAFRPHSFEVQGIKGSEMKMTDKFMVAPGESFPYSLIFIDQDRYSYCKPSLTRIKRLWEKSVAHAQPGRKHEELFEMFLKDTEVLELLKELRKMSYWEEGTYDLLVRVTTAKPEQNFDIKKSFYITKDDLNQIKDSPVHILADLCKIQGTPYKFASVVMT